MADTLHPNKGCRRADKISHLPHIIQDTQKCVSTRGEDVGLKMIKGPHKWMQRVHMHASSGKLKGLVSTAPLMQNLNTFQENCGMSADMSDDVHQSKLRIGLS